jgi:hypothetical protein
MVHYAQWVDSPHPKWLTQDDIEAMLDSRLWFARKFRPEEPALGELDRLLDDWSAQSELAD